MRILCGILAGIVAMQLTSAVALADETVDQLPANLTKCYNEAYSTVDIVDCTNKEAQYWDNMLNNNYRRARQACKVAAGNVDPGEQEQFIANCHNELKQAQLNWIAFRDHMNNIQCTLSPNYGGTMQQLDCASGYNQLIKEQAKRLGDIASSILDF